jgi:hypothetical protein
MKLCGCKHPLHLLAVEKSETVEIFDEDFEEVTYYFRCYSMRCAGSLVTKKYIRTRYGVEAFLEKAKQEGRSRLKFHYCAAGQCRVKLFDPREAYCQHHESNSEKLGRK